MKRILIFSVLAIFVISLTSCVESSKKYKALQAQVDSLSVTSSAEFEEVFATLNEVENGLKSIREAENILVLQTQKGGAEVQANSREQLKSDVAAIGEINYGVTPGEGSLRATLRSFKDEDLEVLCRKIEQFAKGTAERQGLKLFVSYHDKFPATVNSEIANEMVIKAAKDLGLNIIYVKDPTRGSDDFSFFTIKSYGAFFDFGNGEGRADIHQPDYQFPDEILIPAINLFSEIIYKQTK